MSRLFMLAVFVGGLFYLYQKQNKPPEPTPEQIAAKQAEELAMKIPPPPPELERAPPPVMSDAELNKIRLATNDSDPQVRWAAIELLYRLDDPQAFGILEKTLRIDTEPSVRQNALQIMQGIDRPEVAMDLVGSLRDTEKSIRIAALIALGEIADPTTTPHIVKALVDIDPDVRTQALHTLGRIQEKKDAEHRENQDKIRRDYEMEVEEIKSKMAYKKQEAEKKARDLFDSTLKKIEKGN
jgi:vesicle coat complex subunit